MADVCLLWKGHWTPKGVMTPKLRTTDLETAAFLCISTCSLWWVVQDLSLPLHSSEKTKNFLSVDSSTSPKYPVLASFPVKGECFKPFLTSGIFEEMKKLHHCGEGDLGLLTLTCGMTHDWIKKSRSKIHHPGIWKFSETTKWALTKKLKINQLSP